MYNFPTFALKKAAILSHRWSGAAFCVLFSWWFVSGIFMMYCDYPEVKESDRLAHAQPIDATRVILTPDNAWARLKLKGVPDGVTLAMFDGRPAYFFRLAGSEAPVYADTGETQNEFPPDLNLRTAAAWTGQPGLAALATLLTEEDQWTVGGVYRSNAPLTKYSWTDGQQVYISHASGQVVQYTTRLSRLGAWLGPIPHWLYFTPLRKHSQFWSKVIIWVSGAATLVALLGLSAGLAMYSPGKRYRPDKHPSSIPYAGPKRLHMILGLFFGILACTWAFSGMLSMDPFGAPRVPEVLNGEPFAFEPFMAKHPPEALGQVKSRLSVKELDFVIIGGEPYYIAKQDPLNSLVIPVKGNPTNEFDSTLLIKTFSEASQPFRVRDARRVTRYDAYYLDRRRELPLPALLLRLNDPQRTRLYVDPRTARIAGSYSSAAWAERWLYHGLHSINLPWLYIHRPAWDIVVLFLMSGGLALSVTSVIIGWRLLRRKAYPAMYPQKEQGPSHL